MISQHETYTRKAPGPEQPDAAPAPPPGQTPRADGRSAACVVQPGGRDYAQSTK